MDSVQGFLVASGWFLLRFGIPIVLTLIVCRLFQKLDNKWRAEGETILREGGFENVVPTIRCWILNDCPESQREKCQAYQEQQIPCWQHFRARNGELKEKCIGCGVFRGAPVPAIGD